MADLEYTVNVLDKMLADERRAVLGCMEAYRRIWNKRDRNIVGVALMRLVRACARTTMRRDSDARTDAERRVLVGARVPRAFYERCRNAATASGRSLYRFTVDALSRECQEVITEPSDDRERD